MNPFKKALQAMTSVIIENEKSPLSYELPKETILTEKERGKYGVLGTNKFEKREDEENEK